MKFPRKLYTLRLFQLHYSRSGIPWKFCLNMNSKMNFREISKVLKAEKLTPKHNLILSYLKNIGLSQRSCHCRAKLARL